MPLQENKEQPVFQLIIKVCFFTASGAKGKLFFAQQPSENCTMAACQIFKQLFKKRCRK